MGVETELDFVVSDRDAVFSYIEFLRQLEKDARARFLAPLPPKQSASAAGTDADTTGEASPAPVEIERVSLDGIPLPEVPAPSYEEEVVTVDGGAAPVPEYDPFATNVLPVNSYGNPANPVDVSSAFSFLDTN